jgi:hypothetical protein
VNADKKLGVNPCNDRPITDFVGQDEKDQIRPSQAEFIEKVDIISIASTRGGGQNAIKHVGFAKNSRDRSKTDQTSLKIDQTNYPQGFGHKAKSKMLKPKNTEVNVWKANEVKARDQRMVRKLKPQKIQAKSQKANCNKYASWPKNSKHEKSPHDQNRQWNNYDTSMSIPSYRSYNHTPWRSYHDMPYFYSPWSSGMSSPPIYFYPVLIPHGGLSASRSSPAHNDRSYSKD